jgi:predicted hydrocarbon binding protein
MGKTVARFEGKLDDFLGFLTEEWGWIIEYSKQDGVIMIDENKEACVCPLVRKDIGMKSRSLCYCSEGFAEKMFSAVAGFPVRAEVTESILRGAKSCKYRIDLKPLNNSENGTA